MTYRTREEWLHAAADRLIPRIAAASGRPAPKLAVIAGWPSDGPRSATIGECYSPVWTEDGTTYIMITPALGDDVPRVLDVLLHELVHAFGYHGHKKDFAEVARAVGLTGKMTCTVATDELRSDLQLLANELGPYPHVLIRTPGRGTGRWRPTLDKPTLPPEEREPGRTPSGRKLCPYHVSPVEPDYKLKIAPSRVEKYGAPICPISGLPMIVQEYGEED